MLPKASAGPVSHPRASMVWGLVLQVTHDVTGKGGVPLLCCLETSVVGSRTSGGGGTLQRWIQSCLSRCVAWKESGNGACLVGCGFNIPDCSGGSWCFRLSLVVFNLITRLSVYSVCALCSPFPLEYVGFMCTNLSSPHGEYNRGQTGVAVLKLHIPAWTSTRKLRFAICKREKTGGAWGRCIQILAMSLLLRN